MAPASRLIESRRSQRIQTEPLPTEMRRDTVVGARWRVHVPPSGDAMPDTAIAGADLELVSESRHSTIEPGHDPMTRLALTFWIDRGQPEDLHREMLALFAQDPGINLEPPKILMQHAIFELAHLDGGVNIIASSGGKPLLHVTQVTHAPGKRPMLWCRGCIHELLGLAGGQYRLEEVRINIPLATSIAASSTLAREAG